MADPLSCSSRTPLPLLGAPLVDRLRQNLSPVLVLGGNAGDRVRVAKAFHRSSLLHEGPFMTVDCERDEGDLQSAMRCWLSALALVDPAENPLRACERGTLFLDRVDRLSPGIQSLVVRFMRGLASRAGLAGRDAHPNRGSARAADASIWAGRLAAGSSVNLEEAVAGGHFLSSLLDEFDKIRIELDVTELLAVS